MANRTTQTATIANNASLSGAVNIGEYNTTIAALVMPAAWTAAALTFQASYDGTNFFNMKRRQDDGTLAEYIITAPSAGDWIVIDPADFAGVRSLKVRSGTAGLAVNQGAARDIILRVLSL